MCRKHDGSDTKLILGRCDKCRLAMRVLLITDDQESLYEYRCPECGTELILYPDVLAHTVVPAGGDIIVGRRKDVADS